MKINRLKEMLETPGPFQKEALRNIEELKKYIGKEVPDNSSPTFRAKVMGYSDGIFRLKNPNRSYEVTYWDLDTMIFGR